MNPTVLGYSNPKVRWTLPTGDTIVSTMLDYSLWMRAIWEHQASWRNAANVSKRDRMEIDIPDVRQELVRLRRQDRELRTQAKLEGRYTTID